MKAGAGLYKLQGTSSSGGDCLRHWRLGRASSGNEVTTLRHQRQWRVLVRFSPLLSSPLRWPYQILAHISLINSTIPLPINNIWINYLLSFIHTQQYWQDHFTHNVTNRDEQDSSHYACGSQETCNEPLATNRRLAWVISGFPT